MTDEAVIHPVITQGGVTKTMLATNAGMKARITHVAIGDGKLVGGERVGYTPTANMTALWHEFARYPIGSAENLTNNEVALSVMCDGPAEGWVREIGYFLDDGTLFAVWSDPVMPLFFKQTGVAMASVLTLALFGLPANSVQMIVGAPNVNLTIIGAFASLSADVMELQRRVLIDAVDTYTARIAKTYA